jgi:hypothetical protein
MAMTGVEKKDEVMIVEILPKLLMVKLAKTVIEGPGS